MIGLIKNTKFILTIQVIAVIEVIQISTTKRINFREILSKIYTYRLPIHHHRTKTVNIGEKREKSELPRSYFVNEIDKDIC